MADQTHFYHDDSQSVPLKHDDAMSAYRNAQQLENVDIEARNHAQDIDDHQYEEPFDISLKKYNQKNALKNLIGFVFSLVFMIGLPLGLYFGLRNVIGELYALLISGIPPLLHVIYTFIRKRRVDVLGVLVLFAFVISAVISIVTGDARAALLRDSAVTMVIAALFAFTLIPIRTERLSIYPITWSITRKMIYDNVEPYHWRDQHYVRHEMPFSDFIWSHLHAARKGHYLLTAGYAIGLTAEFVIRVIMVEATSLSVSQIVLYGNIVVFSVVVVMTAFGIYVSIDMRRKSLQWAKDNDYTAQYNSTLSTTISSQ
ncbi:hypothetical protein LRAMOSA03166 [Lichtheimia ramosa]|uniref:Uncharacterized protein n=1 Tax=Lichtheimia ramosa TaxID=688394 RepID=A0A077WT58_9FUNG|nr:hypothetical protein LRAMOSA03166 [Lichtheimia ramosa]